MAIRSFKPYTPGTRTRVVTDFSEVTSNKPERSLVVSKHRKKGRNNRGVITCRHRGGGCLLYTSPSPRDVEESRMPSSA